jgi:hypothetical protein
MVQKQPLLQFLAREQDNIGIPASKSWVQWKQFFAILMKKLLVHTPSIGPTQRALAHHHIHVPYG